MDIITAITDFNAGREPERLALKYQKMATSPFIFLRGSCHLFYQRLVQQSGLAASPASWLSGDLHLENFGCYKGDNRQVYFDVNDFDEAILAPSSWDVVRLVTSILVAAQELSLTPIQALSLAHIFLDAYQGALAKGKANWVERETATGLVKTLLDAPKSRQRAVFLDSRTKNHHGQRRITLDTGKALAVSDVQRQHVQAFMADFAAQQTKPDFYRVIDVARRIAGTGSLGVARYVVLVEGKGSPDGNYLLDLKQAVPSSLAPYATLVQPVWQSEAHRVVDLQQRMQAVPMAFLNPVTMNQMPFVLRGLQPSEDRVDLVAAKGATEPLASVLKTMGEVLAWGQLRSAGRQGSAIADELIDFAQQTTWQRPMIEVAQQCAKQTQTDWQDYVQAFRDGMFAG